MVNTNNDVLTGIRFMMTQMNAGIMKWTPVSVHTIKEFNSYIWDEKAAEHGIDAVVKEHDHCMDADRYFAMKRLYKKKKKHVRLIKEGF